MEGIRDRLWKKAGQKGIPIIGVFELLPTCNLSCKMCYVRKSMSEVKQMGGLLNKEQWLELAQQCCDLGMLYPLITGGEPFLHPEFREIMAGMLDMGMQVSVNSNGTLIDKETCEWLSKHKPVRINITLYGASEETYQALCGNGEAYKKVCNAVYWLKAYHIPVKFNTSLTPYNVNDLEKMMAFAKKVESPIQVASYMFPPVRRDATLIGQNERLSPKEAAMARVKADYLQSEPDWFLGQTRRYMNFIPLNQLPSVSEYEGMRMQCRAGYSSLWLDWQGNISNCGMYASVTHPIEGAQLSGLWNELRQETFDVRYKSCCTKCPNQWLCHSCIAMIYSECGSDGGTPHYICEMQEYSAKYYKEYAQKYYSNEWKELLSETHIDKPDASQSLFDDFCDIDN
ncbi:MAG: radical SAM protein [Erysipelotrichaceae bacterium]|nr:radical SAM protein [Erysipelotrichaceae bacterium]